MRDFNRDRSGGGNFRRGGFNDRNSDRPTMHQAICDKCRKECEVPFRPTSGKPVFCSNCFENNRSEPSRTEGRSFERSSFDEKRMFEAVCSSCGANCKVPFEPRGDKPIYCSNCFETKGNSTNTRNSEGSEPQYKQQFEVLNSKLDKILNILLPIATEVEAELESVVDEEVVEKKVKVKTPKKSASKKK